MSLFRRNPKRSSRAELADIFEAGRAPDPDWIEQTLPCGETLRVLDVEPRRPDPFGLFTPDARLRGDVARHENTCDVCHALVSHPDFGLEWTA